MVDAAAYDAHSYQYCPRDAAATANVSPFNLLEFVTHLKNHSGPIQHDRAEASAGALNYCRQAGRNRTKHCGMGFHGR